MPGSWKRVGVLTSPTTEKVPFKQEGLKSDSQKDFRTGIKGIGHRLEACEERNKSLEKFGQRGLLGP